MSITSFYFLIFYVLILGLYYLIPKKWQWIVLLLASISYYLFSNQGFLILYPIFSVIICCIGIRRMVSVKEQETILKENGKDPERMRRNILFVVILCNVAVLFLLKYVNFGINTINLITDLIGEQKPLLQVTTWLVPLGISYYSLSLIGYVVDVYYGIAQPLKKPAKLALYGMFFPCMLSGPILRYREDGNQFFEPHYFDYKQIAMGMQRVLWGFFKVLVISERMAVIVNTIYGDYTSYPGIFIWVGTVSFAFQLYTNFSGGMDIALGIGQTFGLKLPENFDRPFFSKSISEYWRRWHITLGIWMKEYVFYPLLRSDLFTKMGRKLRSKYGKKRGKQITTFVGMFLLWFAVGIWHGGDWKYVIGSGLLHWFYIVSGELLKPYFEKWMKELHINPKALWVNIFMIFRTFLLVNIGFVFFRATSVGDALRMLKEAVSVFNPVVLFNGTLFSLGLDWIEVIIVLVSLLLLFLVSFLQKNGSVREMICGKKIVIRWLIWYSLLFYVILLGYYGPGFSTAEFIYQGF